jgi:hypothetical protein
MHDPAGDSRIFIQRQTRFNQLRSWNATIRRLDERTREGVKNIPLEAHKDQKFLFYMLQVNDKCTTFVNDETERTGRD